MAELVVKSRESCRWDCVALGEVMLRLDPGDMPRAHGARVPRLGRRRRVQRRARAATLLRADTAVVTALADNPVGRLVEDLMLQGGVEQRVKWVKYDGVGRTVRNGLNFTERGFGVRAALGVSDRGHTAVSQLEPGDIDFEEIFGRLGARWFHTGGIFCALSETTPLVAEEAMKAARKHGTVISYDLNYRDSLWKSIGGQAKAREVNRRLAPYIDVMLGNEEDFSAALGFEVEGVDEHLSELDPANFKKMIEQVVEAYPNLKVVATTLRNATTASVNDWGAIALGRRRLLPGAHARAAGDLGPRRRRRLVRVGPRLRVPGRQGPALRRRLRRGARRAGHDDARRHEHGDAGRGRACDEGRDRAGGAVEVVGRWVCRSVGQ